MRLPATDDLNLERLTCEAVLILRVKYPETYPDVPPDLDLSNPHNAPKYEFLDLHEDKTRLLDSLQPTIKENLGMAMVFALLSTLKEKVESLISERQQVEQAAKDKEAAKAEEEENRKFHGSAVTRVSFFEWHAKFKKEMEYLENKKLEEKDAEDKKKRVVKEEKKLTGRELWERGLAGKVEEDEAEDASPDMAKMKLEP